MAKSNNKATTIIIGIIILGLFVFAISERGDSYDNTVQVSGQANIEVSPDIITVYFNADTSGTTSKEASDKNSAVVNNLKASLVALGFDENDLQTQSFNIYPEYNNMGQQKGTYRATHSLNIKLPVDTLNKVGDVVDAGVNAGTGISYINFELTQENQNKYKAEAIRIAAEDAKTKAQAVAEGFDKKLGRLVSTSVDSFDYIPWIAYDSSGTTGSAGAEQAREAASSIQPSEQSVSARVTAVFEIR